MFQYLDLMGHILRAGSERIDRTGVGTLSLFGQQISFDLDFGFPLVTTKRIHIKSVIHELLWFLSGNTNIKYLNDNGVTLWDEWADQNGDLGPIYGAQWRSWNGIDQISDVIDQIRINPHSRRLIVSAWNVYDIGEMALPPCHCFFQFYIHDKELSCQLYLRSSDVFLGLPFNIASYALLLMMMAQVCNLKPKKLTICIGDSHLYLNHLPQAKLQLSRSIKRKPKMVLNPQVKDIFKFTYSDFTLEGYDPHPHIKAEVAV